MTDVLVDLVRPSMSGLAPATGAMVARLFRRQRVGDSLVMVTGFRQVLTSGKATLTLTPNTSTNLWVLTEETAGGGVRYVTVPDSTDPIKYADLVDVDPATLLPVPAAIAAPSTGSSGVAGVSSVNNRSGAVTLAKGDVGLGSVDNTADSAKPISSATTAALTSKADLVGGKVPASQLPTAPAGYTDSQAAAAAPVQSVAGKAGTVSLVKGDVGLGSVDNTTDAAKPISTAQQTALDGKVPTTRTVAGKALSTDVTLAKADVGLGNVDNTADTAKPISTAQANALALKAPLASPAFTGTPTAPTATTGDSSTALATTAFVAGAVSGVSSGGGGNATRFASARKTSGNRSVTTSSFTAFDTATNLTLSAATGSLLEVLLNTQADKSTVDGTEIDFTVLIMSNGTAVRSLAGDTSAAISSWTSRPGDYNPGGGAANTLLTSSDIYNGTVTVQLMVKMSVSGNRALFANSANPTVFSAKTTVLS